MKKIIGHMSIALLLFASNACTESDNYDAPSDTITGMVMDKNTGNSLQTEIGDNGIRLKLMEYSWSQTPTPYYFAGMQNGTFNNTRIFRGNYGIEIMGAFVPQPEIRYDVKGTLELKIEVEPFLNIEWIGEPIINKDSTISIQAYIERGTKNADYQQNISDVRLFVVAGAQHIGENNKDDRYSLYIDGGDANAMLGQTLTLSTRGKLLPGRSYHIRVGARMDKEIDGRRRYNYNAPKIVTMP